MVKWNCFFPHPFCLLIILASSQAFPDPLPNKNKGESLEDFDHVLDMFGCGLELLDHTSKY